MSKKSLVLSKHNIPCSGLAPAPQLASLRTLTLWQSVSSLEMEAMLLSGRNFRFNPRNFLKQNFLFSLGGVVENENVRHRNYLMSSFMFLLEIHCYGFGR